MIVRAQPPASRPTWVLILGTMMLLASGSSLISGALKLSDPGMALSIKTPERRPTAVGAEVPGATVQPSDWELGQKLAAAKSATLRSHRTAVLVDALIEVLLALLGLYATAAVMSGDRHGRRLSLLTAGLVIVYLVGCLPMSLSLMRDYADHAADLLALALHNAGKETDLPSAVLAQNLRSAMIVEAIMASVIGVVCALVLIAFFGGRRGRRLYGLEPTPGPGRRDVR